MNRTRPTSGFTLIELLVVVVIIGLLAAIAIPKFAATKDKAHKATMKGDLRNLATAQESYWSDFAVYYNGTVPNSALLYNPSPGINITIGTADAGGWAASATASAVTGLTCALFVGTAAPVAPATVSGIIGC
ncbi:MAG: prepilin-type N-terminal cleavage/methylation domain-containing protein [Gemmatimonadota bacterium]|nr:prepilin-type N-terminal cleavage/methylation domain-containing protein [Gemmatimonadota bacterium]